MTFISYAQNFEDIMLWRALKHVENGLYIDIGAQDPVVDSVSLAFYEHGWRGIHVEPVLDYVNQLATARPDETVIPAAVGKGGGLMPFFVFPDTGLSTADAAIAQRHQDNGFQCVETKVPVISLDEILETANTRPVHWLKLDVEGMEKDVLKSWKKSNIKPWILVIESTLPLSQEESYQEWERLVLSREYEFVYSDGLNRYYINTGHPELKSAFSVSPNIFDGFVFYPGSRFRAMDGDIYPASKTLPESQFYHCVARIEQISKELNLQNENIEALTEDLHERSSELAELSSELSARDARIAALGDDIHERNQQLEHLSSELSTRDARIETLNENLHERSRELADLSSELSARDARIAALGEELHERTRQLEHSSSELSTRDARIETLNENLCEKNAEIENLSKSITDLNDQMHAAKQETYHWWLAHDKMSMELNQIREMLNAVYESKSWRITASLRWLKAVKGRLLRNIKARLKMTLHSLAACVYRYPRLRRIALRIVNRIPKLKYRLIEIVGQAPTQLNRVNGIPGKIKNEKNANEQLADPNVLHENKMKIETQNLPPHAYRFYKILKFYLVLDFEEKN